MFLPPMATVSCTLASASSSLAARRFRSSVDLLVLRSTDIDSTLESATDLNLGLLPRTLKQLRQAISRLRGMGFATAIIAADHGFCLNFGADTGDVCSKPPGSWIVNAHDRMLLGSGSSDAGSLVIPGSKLGIKSEHEVSAAIPKSLVPYSAGHLYFHGGLSFQEAIIPVLKVNLSIRSASEARKILIKLTYRSGAKRISSRNPVVDLEFPRTELFTHLGDPVEILVEAYDKKGNLVGETRPGGEVNAATRTIRIEPGAKKQLVLVMKEDFEGKFSVKAVDPATMATYVSIDLETDYTV